MIVAISTLSRELAEQYIQQLVALDVAGSGWSRQQFLSELPEKWVWSRVAIASEAIAGVLIASQRAFDHVHIHELIVSQQLRRAGIGRRLIESLMNDAVSAIQIARVSLKVSTENRDAQRFYFANGFEESTKERDMLWLTRNLIDVRSN